MVVYPVYMYATEDINVASSWLARSALLRLVSGVWIVLAVKMKYKEYLGVDIINNIKRSFNFRAKWYYSSNNSLRGDRKTTYLYKMLYNISSW